MSTRDMQLSIIKYIRQFDQDIPKKEVVKHFENEGDDKETIYAAMNDLENLSNIGQWWDSEQKCAYIRWYPPTALTNQVQECLDRGDDW